MRERDRQRQRERKQERDRQRERERMLFSLFSLPVFTCWTEILNNSNFIKKNNNYLREEVGRGSGAVCVIIQTKYQLDLHGKQNIDALAPQAHEAVRSSKKVIGSSCETDAILRFKNKYKHQCLINAYRCAILILEVN